MEAESSVEVEFTYANVEPGGFGGDAGEDHVIVAERFVVIPSAEPVDTTATRLTGPGITCDAARLETANR